MAKFKTRARTVDMLGRQQIAGIATAISELFKNAHDAYADRVEVDYYRESRLFVLRDDGLGMTRDDFEGRWLTIGTESKLDARSGLYFPPQDSSKPRRPLLGEKGIGRLAIAAIGPQVLVLTRAVRDGELQSTIAAYIHWNMFEMPGIDLDDIEIPVREFSDGRIPTAEDVKGMVGEFSVNLDAASRITHGDLIDRIRADFRSMVVDVAAIEAEYDHFDLSGDKHGTHFFIRPAYEIIEADIDESDKEKASNLEKLLLGFTNTMTPGHPEPVVKTAFRDHRSLETFEDLVNDEKFFTPTEFENADHHIRGRFDEYGQFLGTVSVYGEQHEGHVVPWGKAKGRKTLCGPFLINVAHVQGNARESTLPLEEYARLTDKMNRFGGLYIYKDGIRILPYGDTDYDWLEIEKRRTKSASYYFFSYRRIFGVVELTSSENYELSEKAGREGFRESKAYKEFRDILKSFFVQIAADFFREDGPYATQFHDKKSELVRLEMIRRRREGLATEKRRRFDEELEGFFSALDVGRPQEEALTLAQSVEQDLRTALAIPDPRIAAKNLLDVELNAHRRLGELEGKYRIVKPRGVGFGRRLLRDYENYLDTYDGIRRTVFSQVRDLIDGEVARAASSARITLDKRVRLERVLQDLSDQARREVRGERSTTMALLERVNSEIRDFVRKSVQHVESAIQNAQYEFARLDVSGLSEADLLVLRRGLESSILTAIDFERDALGRIRAQIESVSVQGDYAQIDEVEALEQRNMMLEEQADADLQLVQLGMAIEVINHEFDASVRGIRNELRRLKAWADANQSIRDIYDGLRNNFDHLDSYLSLFTPLHRRLYRKEVEISGGAIREYLQGLFGRRMDRHGIELAVTEDFARATVVGYPSSFYPVFVNLVDNAIFWLADSALPRIILLDADGGNLFVSNSGPAVPQRHVHSIFDQGVSLKPGGRGLGLFISKQILGKVGYELSLVSPRQGMGVTFCVSRDTIE